MVPANQLAPPDEEHFNPSLVSPLGQGDKVHVAAGVGFHLDLLFLGYPVNAAYLVAQDGGPLKLQFLRSQLHFPAQLPGNAVGIPFHKHHDLLDYLGILLLARQAGAGSHATVDIVFQAGAGVVAGDGLGAGTVGKQLLD